MHDHEKNADLRHPICQRCYAVPVQTFVPHAEIRIRCPQCGNTGCSPEHWDHVNEVIYRHRRDNIIARAAGVAFVENGEDIIWRVNNLIRSVDMLLSVLEAKGSAQAINNGFGSNACVPTVPDDDYGAETGGDA